MLKGHIYYAFWLLKGEIHTHVLGNYVRDLHPVDWRSA
jgi:hypothetical protein